MRLAILQPFYLPYLGVFEQVRLADAWVIYDDVQFVKQNWQHRNRVKTQHGPKWLTVPVYHDHGQLINETRVNNEHAWTRQHWNMISMEYARAPHVCLIEEHLESIYEDEWDLLVDLDLTTFGILCGLMDVQAEFLRSSELGVGGSGTERIVQICEELGADRYLSGPAARNYLDEEAFADRGIQLEYFAFDHPTYDQLHGDFVPYLSVIDLIANVGREAPEIAHGTGRAVPVEEWEPGFGPSGA